MAPLVGAYYLQRPLGGRGTLLSGVPGVPPGDVVIIGGGIVGLNSAKVALGMGARVTILETNGDRMRFLDDIFHGSVTTLASNAYNLAAAASRADIVIGAVLIPGALGAQAGDARDDPPDEGGGGGGGRRRRPGRLLRDDARDDPLGPGVHRRRRGALLRRQHARGGAAHLDLRAQQRDGALHAASSPTRASSGRCARTPTSPTASTPTRARSSARRWRSRRGGRSRRSDVGAERRLGRRRHAACDGRREGPDWARLPVGTSPCSTKTLRAEGALGPARPTSRPTSERTDGTLRQRDLWSAARARARADHQAAAPRARCAVVRGCAKASRQAWRAGRGKSRSAARAAPVAAFQRASP